MYPQHQNQAKYKTGQKPLKPLTCESLVRDTRFELVAPTVSKFIFRVFLCSPKCVCAGRIANPCLPVYACILVQLNALYQNCTRNDYAIYTVVSLADMTSVHVFEDIPRLTVKSLAEGGY
jgi:hypothetical protein